MTLLLQVIALLFTLISVYLSAKRHISTWSVGIIGIISFFLLFLDEKLYFQASLQVVFLLQSLYGWYLWSKSNTNHDFNVKIIEKSRLYTHFFTILVVGLVVGYFMSVKTDDPLPYLDAISTAMAILATYYLGKTYIQVWFVWMIVNILIFIISLKQGMYMISYLELILFMLSWYGYINWSILLKDGKDI